MSSRVDLRPYLAVVAGGLAAGALDILYAFVLAGMSGSTPLRILQSVASGLLRKQAFAGGAATGALGLALHLGITIVAAGIYFVAAKHIAVVRRHYVVSGLAFGILVYLAMNFAVLPLSAVPFKIKYTTSVVLQGFISHALLVGLPIAWCLQRLAFNREAWHRMSEIQASPS